MAEKSLSFRGPLLAAVACCALASACKDDDHPAFVSGYGNPEIYGPISDCELPDICDIDETSCQKAVLEVTACVRGDDVPKLPSIRVITQDEFRTELEERVEMMSLSVSPWDPALQAIGLSEPGMSSIDASIDEQVQSILAYYDDQSKGVTIIKEQMSDDDTGRMYVLSHELTHYLQDRESNLGRLTREVGGQLDRQTALKALVEGEATATSSLTSAFIRKQNLDRLDWRSYFDDMLAGTLLQIASSPSPLFSASQALPYPIGGDYVSNTIEEEGRQEIDTLFRAPSTSFVEWVAPFGSGKFDLLEDLAEPLKCAPPLPPEGMVVFGIDSFGAAGLIALLSRGPQLDRKALVESVSHLRGDAFAVYATSTDQDAALTPVAVAWRLRFDDEAAATELADRIRDIVPLRASITTHDSEVLIVNDDDTTGKTQSSFSEAAQSACPKLQDLEPKAPMENMSALRRGLFPHHTFCSFPELH